jgi:hypothetical protein
MTRRRTPPTRQRTPPTPSFHAEAHKILSELAEKDLIASPEGYAALAKIRSNLGDKEGAESAVKRCMAMSKDPKTCQGTASDASSRS